MLIVEKAARVERLGAFKAELVGSDFRFVSSSGSRGFRNSWWALPRMLLNRALLKRVSEDQCSKYVPAANAGKLAL